MGLFNLEGFEVGYRQALIDLMDKYADMEDYDEIFVRNLKRHVRRLMDALDDKEEQSNG